jgi:hypothetical protein
LAVLGFELRASHRALTIWAMPAAIWI